MKPLPDQMRDRWANRQDTPPGKGTIYWHILMGDHPEVRSLAQKAQNQLARFSGLHMTPLDWLHMSTLVLGRTDEVSSDQMQQMQQTVSTALEETPPIDITLGRVLYHPEAIMLGVKQSKALEPLLCATKKAAITVLGKDGRTTSGRGDWVPHMTLCYSTSEQPARPLFEALGAELPECSITIRELTLVIQWGPERQWNWERVAAVRLDSKR